MQPVGVNQRMLGSGNNLDVFETGGLHAVGDKLRGAPHIGDMLGQSTDAGDAQEGLSARREDGAYFVLRRGRWLGTHTIIERTFHMQCRVIFLRHASSEVYAPRHYTRSAAPPFRRGPLSFFQECREHCRVHLEREFGGEFATLHGLTPDTELDNDELSVFLSTHRDIKAVSSHHLRYPLPNIKNVVIFDLCFTASAGSFAVHVLVFTQGKYRRGIRSNGKHSFYRGLFAEPGG